MRVLAFVLFPALALAAPVRQAPAESEEQRAAAAIENTLQRHAGDVHRCFGQALADRLDVAGQVEIAVDVGAGGKVDDAKLVSQKGDLTPGLPSCVLAAATTWKVDGIEPGASLVLPFAFQGQANQFVVKEADAPERGPGAAPAKGAKGKPPRQGPFTVKVLADEQNVRARNVSLTLLTIGPANRVAMHRHPQSAKILYLLKGRARLLGPPGTPPQNLTEGSAAFIPMGYPHVIENMGRQAPAVMLQAFGPPGPEKVYRDPTDATGRAAFDVIRDPKKATLPPASAGKLVVVQAAEGRELAMAGTKGTARIVLDPAVTGSNTMALDLIELSPGAEVPRHAHAGSTEVLYVLSGGGKLSVGSESYPFGPEDVIHVPADQPHGATFSRDDKTVAIQIYAPAGPEQRFRAPAPTAPKPAAAPAKTK